MHLQNMPMTHWPRYLSAALLAAACCPAFATAIGIGLGGAITDFDGRSTARFDDTERRARSLDFVGNFGSQDQLFNWRLGIGAIAGDIEDENGSELAEFDGLIISNTASFGTVRSGAVRMWLGPSFSLELLDFRTSNGENDDGSAFSLGIAAGIDIDLQSGAPILSLELGYQPITSASGDDVTDDASGDRVFGRLALLWGR